MEPEEIKAMVRRFNDEVWMKRNLAVFDEVISPDYKGYGNGSDQPITGEELKNSTFGNINALKDAQLKIDEILVDGEAVAFRWTATANSSDGKPLKVAGMSFYHLKNGKITEDYFLNVPVEVQQPVA